MSPISVATFSELTCAIYDCAIDPRRWPETLDRFRRHFDFENAVFDLFAVSNMRALVRESVGLTAEDSRRIAVLEPEIPEIWGGPALYTRPIDEPWVTSRILSWEEIERTRYFREWAGPRGLIDSAMIVLARDGRLIGSMGMGRHRDQGPITDEVITQLRPFVPHFQRAAQISGLLEANAEALDRFATVIEKLTTPVIFVAADLAIVDMNGAARELLDDSPLLKARNGVLTSDIPGVRQAILASISSGIVNEATIPGKGDGLPIRTGNGNSCVLHFMPLVAGRFRPRLSPGAVAAIFVSDKDTAVGFDYHIFETLFELSRAEMRVFSLIVGGATTQEAANTLSLGKSTVRSHLLNIFQKTGVSRQSDLIRMAHSLAPPITQ